MATDGIDNYWEDGSSAHPWATASYAVGRAKTESPGVANTILFKPGVYNSFTLSPSCNGTAEAPLTIASEIKWKAIIQGNPIGHGIYLASGTLWIVVDGFEVTGATFDGIKVSGNYSTVKNCWVHNNTQMGISMHGRTNGTIERNLIEYNGTHIQFHHGIYVDGNNHLFNANVIRHNAGNGMQLYPSISHSVIINNLVYGNRGIYKSGILVSCPTGGGQNIIANNTIADNINYGISVWTGNGEIVANNIFYGNVNHTSFTATTNIIALNNLIFNPTTSTLSGTGTIYADPNFVDSELGAYWLAQGSPASASGNITYLPTNDFWGNTYSGLPYIGAFAYRPELVPLTYRTETLGWEDGYGYAHSSSGVLCGPDYWQT